MRIVSWNCCKGRLEEKLPLVLDLNPDVAVLQELRKPETNNPLYGHEWHGSNLGHGVLVQTFGDWRVMSGTPFVAQPEFFLPVSVVGPKEHFNLLAVWVHPVAPTPKSFKGYTKTLIEGLRIHDQFIRSAPTLIVGDFNANLCVPKLCEEYDLLSVYHRVYKAEIGWEPHRTFYRYRHRNAKTPYYMDFCLAPTSWHKRLASVKVGDFAWLNHSDHLPLIVDFLDLG